MRRWQVTAEDAMGISDDNGFRVAFHFLLEHSPGFKDLTREYRAKTSGRRGQNNFIAFGDALKSLADEGAAGGQKLQVEPMPYGLFVCKNFLQWDGETVFFRLLHTGENYIVTLENRQGEEDAARMTAAGWKQVEVVW